MSVLCASSVVLFRLLGSSKLALVLVVLLILFSVVGAVLPQEGMLDVDKIAQWQQEHPTVTIIRIQEPSKYHDPRKKRSFDHRFAY